MQVCSIIYFAEFIVFKKMEPFMLIFFKIIFLIINASKKFEYFALVIHGLHPLVVIHGLHPLDY